MNDIKLSRKNPKPHIRVQWHVWYEHQDDLFTMMLINWSRSVSLENLTWGPRTRYTNQRRPPPPPSDGLPPQRPSDFLPPLKLRLWEFSSDLQRWRSSYSIVLPIMPLLSFSSALADILPLREKNRPGEAVMLLYGGGVRYVLCQSIFQLAGNFPLWITAEKTWTEWMVLKLWRWFSRMRPYLFIGVVDTPIGRRIRIIDWVVVVAVGRKS